MSDSAPVEFIGFPPPLLGESPLRLPILDRGDGWIALNKPAGVAVREYPWDLGIPDLDAALNRQLSEGKPELLRLRAEIFGSVYYMDPVMSGLALFATNREALEFFRNQFGSMHMQFRFLLVTPEVGGDLSDGFETEAPLLPHYDKPKMIPSTAKGKRARTRFVRLQNASGWSLWEAYTNYPRPHQIRAHFALSEHGILGDSLYGGVAAPTLKDLMPKKRGPGMANPVFGGVALHLESVTIQLPLDTQGQMEPRQLRAPLVREFAVMLKRMGLDAV